MTWAYMYVMGFFFIAYTYKFNRQLLRIQWKTLAKWSAFLVFTGAIKYALYTYVPSNVVDLSAVAMIPWQYMVLAGFEEAMFTLPVYYAMIYSDNKYIRTILMASLALVFASGHVYQGLFAIVPTFLYMFYIAPKYMKKIGFGTMVLAHVMYDLSVWFVVQILHTPDFFNNVLQSCRVV